jgi:hypothetical protein
VRNRNQKEEEGEEEEEEEEEEDTGEDPKGGGQWRRDATLGSRGVSLTPRGRVVDPALADH